jgi:hypothetical protein
MMKERRMEPTRIGDRLFVDGIIRDVFADPDGRQFVLDNDGNPVYGVWIYIPDPDPVIVPGPNSTDQ